VREKGQARREKQTKGEKKELGKSFLFLKPNRGEKKEE